MQVYFELKVNVLFYEKTELKTNKKTKWMWVTDLEPTQDNMKELVKAGRSRWKIENETFNTLKNQGYEFEHNFGHGYKTLSNLFAGMMLLAFLVDQILFALDLKTKQCLEKKKRLYRLRDVIRMIFFIFCIEDWDMFYRFILAPPRFKVA
jgi:hypothetical protein